MDTSRLPRWRDSDLAKLKANWNHQIELMRLTGWFVGLGVVVLLIWAAWGEVWEQRFSLEGAVAELRSAGQWAWALGWGLLVGDIILPVPGTVVMSALGLLYGFVLGGLLASAGSIMAGVIAYGICRMFGEKAARRILGDEDFEKGRRLFESSGGWMVCFSRALPILPEIVACTAGLVRMPFWRFLTALACGSIPLGFVFAWVGAAGEKSPALSLGLSLGLPAVMWLVAQGVMRKISQKHSNSQD